MFCSHNEKGVLEDFSEHPSILVCIQEAHSISMITHVLYIHTASMTEREVTCRYTGTLAGAGIPGRGSMGALEPALLFLPYSDSGLRTVPPSLSEPSFITCRVKGSRLLLSMPWSPFGHHSTPLNIHVHKMASATGK